ncbi:MULTISPECIES: DUF1648 domain-containing protein [Chryseobacterium]|uniref:DUF1648 domain-containing protein n=2 Tax=Chryseobacterium TaxID=59732 RepID=A0A3M7TJZ8_9FLAO|nr:MULTISPECIES: DUF1648 domain-containing protein [Chryseobacterium]RNA63608.1 DUF1648 domain-containing protein [Chryseobacterium nematophagum]CAA7390333.1 hypothetical protein CHRY9393_02637 [Chryseobacterium fistulae]
MKVSGILLGINITLLLFMWIFTAYNYAGLPEIIPTHFLINREIDGESDKGIIWFLPSIATFIFFILFAITHDPKSPMLTIPDSFRNGETLKLFSFTISIPLLLLLGDTLVETVLITQGKLQALSYMAIFLLGLLFFTLGVWIFIMNKKEKS